MKKDRFNFHGLVQKAIFDFGMIEEGDRICVGLSGGKDSMAALHALAHIRRYNPTKFDIVAVTLDLGYTVTDYSLLENFCSSLGVDFILEKTEIGKIVSLPQNKKCPCGLCANLRRGALNRKAVELGCKKVVLGHHRDDAIETFMMSLMYEGRLHSFTPVTYLSRQDIHVIRPLFYAKESRVLDYCRENSIPVLKSPCPFTGQSSRQKTTNLLDELSVENPDLRQCVFTALLNHLRDKAE